MNGFKRGDRVRLGEHIGVVVETRIESFGPQGCTHHEQVLTVSFGADRYTMRAAHFTHESADQEAVAEPDENRDWRDDPANAWCKVCDRGLEGCTHSPVDPEH